MKPKGRVIRREWITRSLVQANPDTLFVFGDNMARRGRGGQAAQMRGEPNAIGVPTKWRPARDEGAYFSDADATLPEVRSAIIGAFQVMREALDAGRDVVIPAAGLGTERADLERRAPRIYRAIQARIEALTKAGQQTGKQCSKCTRWDRAYVRQGTDDGDCSLFNLPTPAWAGAECDEFIDAYAAA